MTVRYGITVPDTEHEAFAKRNLRLVNAAERTVVSHPKPPGTADGFE
jgi:hypothetical protein